MTLFERARAEAEHLLGVPGVVGVGEGEATDGRRSIVVLVTARGAVSEDEIPHQILGVPVETVAVGTIAAERGDTADGAGHSRDVDDSPTAS